MERREKRLKGKEKRVEKWEGGAAKVKRRKVRVRAGHRMESESGE